MIKIFRYRGDDGYGPFSAWLNNLRDKAAQARIRIRLRQIQTGNFGDTKSVGSGVSELHIHLGAGYRIYYGHCGESIVILLCGGNKNSQMVNIAG